MRESVLWAMIAEPGDVLAGAVRQVLGGSAALEWVRSGDTRDLDVDACNRVLERGGFRAADDLGWRLAWTRWNGALLKASVDRELEECASLGVRVIVRGGSEWPAGFASLGLREPTALWIRGDSPLPTDTVVTVTGARAATSYGFEVGDIFARDLALRGDVTVLTGGGYGVEAAALRGVLEVSRWEGCPAGAVVVLSSGLADYYPAGNADLLSDLVGAGGHVVSVAPLHLGPARWRFIERDRLMVAWSDALVVVEAGPRSRPVRMANMALEEAPGVSVCVVPGPVTSASSAGANRLAASGGARVVTCAEDVIDW